MVMQHVKSGYGAVAVAAVVVGIGICCCTVVYFEAVSDGRIADSAAREGIEAAAGVVGIFGGVGTKEGSLGSHSHYGSG